MTKLPQIIEKEVNIFTGCELGSFDPRLKEGRCVGGSTAVALVMLGQAQATGASFGFDFGNYGTSKSKTGASHLLSNLTEIVDKLGFKGFTFQVRKVTELRGLRGLDYHSIVHSLNPHEVDGAYGVSVHFDPIVKVVYDLRK